MYESLEYELKLAFEQASEGKGKERHADGNAFDKQPIHLISELLGSNDGLSFQAIKKIHEAVGMCRRGEYGAARTELHGAIVYIATLASRIARGIDAKAGKSPYEGIRWRPAGSEEQAPATIVNDNEEQTPEERADIRFLCQFSVPQLSQALSEAIQERKADLAVLYAGELQKRLEP